MVFGYRDLKLQDYQDAGCNLLRPSPIILVTIRAIEDPCEQCALNRKPCRDFILDKLNQLKGKEQEQAVPRKTNAQWAKELNISKRQVSKRRKAGTLPKEE